MVAPAAVPGLGRAPNRLRWGRAGLRLGWWALASLGTFWILWPAMWTVPGQAVGSIVGLSLQYASAPGDATAAFFQGEIGHDFGAAFYPLTILYRTTPLALVGALLAVGALCFRPTAGGPTTPAWWTIPVIRHVAPRRDVGFTVLPGRGCCSWA
jgi:hypothetical protein